VNLLKKEFGGNKSLSGFSPAFFIFIENHKKGQNAISATQ
jgi:hypothetical protein